MRRLLGILIALAVPMVVMGAVALASYRPGLPDMAQGTLDRYLVHLRQLGRPAVVVEARTAGYPRSFTAGVSGPTFGDGIYFGVSYVDPDTPAPRPTATVSSILAGPSVTYSVEFTNPGGYGSMRPLPYPPEDIWCVQLQPNAAGSAPEVVLLALHQDLYTAAWAVHELPPGMAAQTLALVGCAFK